MPTDVSCDFYDQSAPVYLEKKDGIGRLVLNRPDKRNAVNLDMWARLPVYLKALDADKDVRVVLVTSSRAGVFCAGADISEFEEIATNAEKRELQRVSIRDGQRTLARLGKPTIAMINGPCVGAGCGISLHCDFRFAAAGSRFGITPAKLGIVYPLNDTKHLVDLVGPSNAKRILFTAGLIDGEKALSMGLIDELFSADALEQETLAFAAQMVGVSQYSLRGMKKTIRRIVDGQVDDDAVTSKWFTDAHTGEDYRAGVKAFMAKEKPKFTWND